MDDSDVLLSELLEQTGRLLQKLKSIKQAYRHTLSQRATLDKAKSSDALTAEEEVLIRGTSDADVLQEWLRLGLEKDELEKAVCMELCPAVWNLFPDIEIDYPKTIGLEQRYRDLLSEACESREDRPEEEWLPSSFLLRLNSMLRAANEHVREQETSNSGPKGSDAPLSVAANQIETRGRGRPPLPYSQKLSALKLRQEGAASRKVAEALYNEKHPTSRQRGNVSSILKYFVKRHANDPEVRALLLPKKSH